MTPTWRSLLFVPANVESRIAKAAASATDAVILDLEDGVARADKPAARAGAASAVAQLRDAGKDVVVRINPGWRDAFADLDAALVPGVTAIMVPKADSAARLTALAGVIDEWEAERGFSGTGMVALVESAAGLIALDEIASAPRVTALALGPEDFATAMGVAPSAELLDLPCRRIVLAAAAAGIAAFATPASIAAFRDETATRAAAMVARAYGGSGALCIHPSQVAIANDAFRPSAEEISDARAIMAAWEAAHGRGVTVLEGRMIDAPVAERAVRILARITGEGK